MAEATKEKKTKVRGKNGLDKIKKKVDARSGKRKTSAPKTAAGSSSREAKRAAAAEKRRQEVQRAKLFLGCAAAALVLFILLALILPGVFKKKTATPQGTLIGVNSDVLQYQEAVTEECQKQGILEYATLLLALMQQESSGQGTDVFQCSESPFNTEYSSSPGSISDVSYSIQVGVQTFAYCLEAAGCESISDTDALKLALQEYNYGNDYAGWALTNYGGYSEENALEFSEKMQDELGWSAYGDPEYVAHVLRYISL